ncbi:MAG: hypothetical protein ACYC9S_07050 [Leptospirales bacterium]
MKKGFLILILALLGACSTTPAPPIFINTPKAFDFTRSMNNGERIPIAVLPVMVPGDDHYVGVMIHASGGRTHLITRNSLSFNVEQSLKAVLRANGYRPYDATTDHHALAIRMDLQTFNDKITANLLHVREKAVLKCHYTIIRFSEEHKTTMVKTSERYRSPTPSAIFDKKTPSHLLGTLLRDSLEKDLIPTLNRLLKQES